MVRQALLKKVPNDGGGMMTNEEYLAVIKKTFGPDCADHVLFCMVGVAGEAGEIANMCQKAMRGDFDPEGLGEDLSDKPMLASISKEMRQRIKLVEEMGGVFYFLHALCWKLGVRPEEVMAINAEKLLSRLERGVIRGDGDER